MPEKAKAPAIRFKGFADVWEQRKLGELCNEFRSGEFIKASDITPLGGYPVYGGNGLRGYANTYNHDGEFALIGRQGALCGNMQFSSGMAYFTEHAVAVSANYENETRFLYHLFGTMNLGQYSGQSAQPGLAVGNLIEIITLVPIKAEQMKIYALFDNLDNLITLRQRKLLKLKNIKKAMLEKMFPQNGSNVPEIRFAGFTDAWEQRKVKDLFKVTRGNVLAATITSEKKTEDTPYPVYSSQTKQDGLLGYYKEFLYEDAITWTTDGANAGTVNYRAGMFYCTNVCGVLLSDEIKANQMISEALNNIAKKYVSYVGNPKLMNNVMAEIEIKLPSQEKERDTISSFFYGLDNLITLHQRKYEKLQNLKKACLERMFV